MTQDKIITLYIFKDILEATVNKLETNGIDSFLIDETTAGINHLGGVELKIFIMDKENANKIIEEFKN